MTDTPNRISKRFRLTPKDNECFENIRSIDSDLSENQVMGRIIRMIDKGIQDRLQPDLLEKYKARELTRDECDYAFAAFGFARQQLGYGASTKDVLERASTIKLKRKSTDNLSPAA